MIPPVNKIDKGKITINVDLVGVTEEEALRYQRTLGVILANGVLGLHNGKAVLSFDYEGELREIDFDFKKWRKQKNDSGV